MKKVHYFRVEMNPEQNIQALKRELTNYIDFKFIDYYPSEEQENTIFRYGVTSIINPIYHEFIGTPRDDRNLFIETLQKFLDNVITTNDLTIIDSYLFPDKHDVDYPNLLIDILKKYIPKLSKLTIVTKNRFNKPLQTTIFEEIKNINPRIIIDLKLTDLFHDRFWLSNPNSKGIFVGTSLNGLGKKYTLIDYINIDDVKQIFDELKSISNTSY